MVKVSIEGGQIVITLGSSKEKILALRSKITIPAGNVVSVSTQKVKPSWLSIKMGTHVPRGFMAGTFWERKGKAFYYVRDFSKCVTLNLRDHEYSKVVVEVGDKEAVAEELRRHGIG